MCTRQQCVLALGIVMPPSYEPIFHAHVYSPSSQRFLFVQATTHTHKRFDGKFEMKLNKLTTTTDDIQRYGIWKQFNELSYGHSCVVLADFYLLFLGRGVRTKKKTRMTVRRNRVAQVDGKKAFLWQFHGIVRLSESSMNESFEINK